MKKRVLIIMLFMCWAFSAHGAELKIGFVDLNKALNESERGKNATKILEDVVNSKKTILVDKEKELKGLDEELKKQSSVLTPESLKSKTEELNKLYKSYQRMVKDFQEEVQKKEAEFTQEIQKGLLEITQQIGKEKGYSIIFEKNASGLIYGQKTIDITEDLIKKYNDISKGKNAQ
jgi:outer membrane protein